MCLVIGLAASRRCQGWCGGWCGDGGGIGEGNTLTLSLSLSLSLPPTPGLPVALRFCRVSNWIQAALGALDGGQSFPRPTTTARWTGHLAQPPPPLGSCNKASFPLSRQGVPCWGKHPPFPRPRTLPRAPHWEGPNPSAGEQGDVSRLFAASPSAVAADDFRCAREAQPRVGGA